MRYNSAYIEMVCFVVSVESQKVRNLTTFPVPVGHPLVQQLISTILVFLTISYYVFQIVFIIYIFLSFPVLYCSYVFTMLLFFHFVYTVK